MFNWYNAIKRYYDMGLWTDKMVGDGVYVGKITPEEYQQITGEVYQQPESTPFNNETSL